MNTIIKRVATLLIAAAAAAMLTLPLLAHGDFEHVRGTVVKVENNVLTVKTAKGNSDVHLNEKTAITKNEQKAGQSDLVPGARVVVDVIAGSKDHLAHSVKVGVTEPAKAAAHEHEHK